jgi:hypothetical protein
MWTGELYGFYTEKPINRVFNIIKEYANSIGYEYEYSSQEREEYLFFYKDEKMYEYHLEHGYNIDINGIGCFSIEAKNTKMDGIATLIKFEGYPNLEPIDINLVFNDVFYYVLVVPCLIENSPFAKKIYDVFHNALLWG